MHLQIVAMMVQICSLQDELPKKKQKKVNKVSIAYFEGEVKCFCIHFRILEIFILYLLLGPISIGILENFQITLLKRFQKCEKCGIGMY